MTYLPLVAPGGNDACATPDALVVAVTVVTFALGEGPVRVNVTAAPAMGPAGLVMRVSVVATGMALAVSVTSCTTIGDNVLDALVTTKLLVALAAEAWPAAPANDASYVVSTALVGTTLRVAIPTKLVVAIPAGLPPIEKLTVAPLMGMPATVWSCALSVVC